ncbi:MAG: YabP/YqfC family sporulation protein [Eubacteriales bacterium]|nr:YabP/YqfC family sporulation protein [Eubacteriales bacterium]
MGFGERITEMLEIPGETMFKLPSLQWTGRDRLYVQNHRGILDYTPQWLVIDTVEGSYKVSGQDLRLEMLSKEALLLRGAIVSITLQSKVAP